MGNILVLTKRNYLLILIKSALFLNDANYESNGKVKLFKNH